MQVDNLEIDAAEFFFLTTYKCRFTATENLGNSVLTAASDKHNKMLYAYSGENGLCNVSEYGTILHKDILGELISLPGDDAKAVIEFFEEYGFLFPISDDEITTIDLNSFVGIINRIKALVGLMSEIEQTKINYQSLLELALYLILSGPDTFRMNSKMSYTSCKYRLDSILSAAEWSIMSKDDTQEAELKGTYSVADTIFGPTYELNADEYDEIATGEPFMFSYPGIEDERYRKLTVAYKNMHHENSVNRRLIDFLFHFMNSVGVIKSVELGKGIEFYGAPRFEKFDKTMKIALLNLSKTVIAAEINYNISKMRPYYNPGTLKPCWKAPNLLTALYFSVFYMQPGSEIFRKCSNPTCNKLFRVKTSNSKKIYCCDACRNASNQRDHRNRIRQSN